MAEQRIQYVASADGTQIAYTTFGEGPPVVLAANAWGDIAVFTSVRSPARLGAILDDSGVQAVVYDGRGSGNSDRGVTDFSQAARFADLEAVVDRLGLERFALLGMVHGCSVAVAYAAAHPERVSRLALFGVYARGEDYYKATPMLRAVKALHEMADEHWDFYTRTMAHWIAGYEDPARAADMAALYRDGMTGQDYVSFARACEATDITDLLPRVKAPTLVVRDTLSPFTVVPEFTRRVAAAIPGAESVTVAGVAAMILAATSFLREEAPGPPAGPASTPASGVVTVLWTDIVGHTAMMRRLGDAKGREVLREHERITREVLSQHSGTEVKTMGDGFMASFASVTKAVECAVALQRAMDDRNRGAEGDVPSERLYVRVGLNAGEPVQDEGDLFGSSVILASRIAAKAQGGEILASLAVRELCAGKGFLFADLGDHELRGFEDPVRIFEVKWQD